MSKVLCVYDTITQEYEEISGVSVGSGLNVATKTQVGKAIKLYIKTWTRRLSRKNYTNDLKYFIKFFYFVRKRNVTYISEINRKIVDEFEAELLKCMIASSVNRRTKTFRSFFARCIEWKYISENPYHGKKPLKIDKNSFIPWTYEEFLSLIDLCSGIRKYAVIFMWLTGCRPTELKNLTWVDVDHERRTLNFKSGKNRERTRKYPISSLVSAFLHQIKVESIFVFSENGNQLSTDRLYQYTKHRFEKLGLKHLTNYGARHGFCTDMADEGLSTNHLSRLMGHSNLQTTQTYTMTSKPFLIKFLDNVQLSNSNYKLIDHIKNVK